MKTRICANPECRKEFTPKNKLQTHCCPKCTSRHATLRRLKEEKEKRAQALRDKALAHAKSKNQEADILSNLKFLCDLPSGLCAQFNPMGGEWND